MEKCLRCRKSSCAGCAGASDPVDEERERLIEEILESYMPVLVEDASEKERVAYEEHRRMMARRSGLYAMDIESLRREVECSKSIFQTQRARVH